MSATAEIKLPDKTVQVPVVIGTENEKAFNIAKLRDATGYITLESGYGNTGACQSAVTFIDGEKGILRYRGYPIEQLAEKSTFVETAWLLIWGELPNKDQLKKWRELLTEHAPLHEGLQAVFQAIPPSGHPMATLSAMINACSCYHP